MNEKEAIRLTISAYEKTIEFFAEREKELMNIIRKRTN